MKHIVLFCLMLFTCVFAKAQNTIYFPTTNELYKNQNKLKGFIHSYFKEFENENLTLQLSFQRQTNFSTHYTFDILFQQIPIFNACIKVNLNWQGQLISIKKEIPNLEKLNADMLGHELTKWSSIDVENMISPYQTPNEIKHKEYFIIDFIEDHPSVFLYYHQWSKMADDTWLINRDAQIQQHFNELHYLNKDSTVYLKIFKPDPLTQVQQPYGGTFIDNADADATWINPTYVLDSALANYDDMNQTFYLENDWIKLDDFEPPTFAPATNTIPEFYFTRSQSGFEDANAFFHITHFHDYISSLGYDTLMDQQLIVDTHGQFSADNSVFNRNGGNPTISYGVGGVDDAEDADVIIHEYSHAISWSANNNATFSIERSGLDEGLADYFATSYSRNISNYNWQQVFSWDGHNTFWAGRTAATTANYPSTGNIYAIGEIWNAAMSGIWTDLGAIITDKLMLESLHFFTTQTTLPEAAIYVLQSDTLLFGGMHSATICNRFRAKNILDANCKPLAIETISNTNEMQLMNSTGFAKGESDLKIKFNEASNADIELLNLQGQVLRKVKLKSQHEYLLNPNEFENGIYIIRINENGKQGVYKVVRW
jgi:hypothetical protein